MNMLFNSGYKHPTETFTKIPRKYIADQSKLMRKS